MDGEELPEEVMDIDHFMEDTRIFIVTHKNIDQKIQVKGYEYLGVGNKKDLDVENRDNTGVNIADKNGSFCELTAQYWIVHNVNAEYVGLVHYRRFFYKSIPGYFFNLILNRNYIRRKLRKYDAILPRKCTSDKSVYDAYKYFHHIKDLDLCGELIKERCPEYYSSFERLKEQDGFSPYNMIITSKKIYDEYSQWLFDILFAAEKLIDTAGYNSYNKRVFGFLSERLLNVYFDHHKEYRVLYKRVYQLGEKNTFLGRVVPWIKAHMPIKPNKTK